MVDHPGLFTHNEGILGPTGILTTLAFAKGGSPLAHAGRVNDRALGVTPDFTTGPIRSFQSSLATRSWAESMPSEPESRGSTLHRLHARRGLRDRDDRGRALCISTRRGWQRRGACPFALRRTDRLAFAGDRRRGQEARTLRLWRRSAYRGTSCQVAGAIGVCLHAAGRCCRAGLRATPRRGVGGRIRRDAAGAARRRDHLCDRWRPRAPGTEGSPQGWSRGVRGHPYERHPAVSPMRCYGKSGSSCRLPISHVRMESISCAWCRRWASSPRPRGTRSKRPIKPSRPPRRPARRRGRSRGLVVRF